MKVGHLTDPADVLDNDDDSNENKREKIYG